MNYEIVDSPETFDAALERVRAAQAKYGEFTQEQVDKIFLAAASAANKMRIPLAKMAVEETGMGIVEDKVIKNNYAAHLQRLQEYKNLRRYRNRRELRHHQDRRAYRCCGRGYSDNEPHLHRDLQDPYLLENQKRYHYKPSPPRKEEHH